jgi:basic membrane protein A
MKFAKFCRVLAVSALSAMLLGGCGSDDNDMDCRDKDTLCVGLVTDVGGIDDKAFNQSVWEGAQQAETELGAKIDYIESENAGEFDANIARFGDKGYEVILTVGFALNEATMTAANVYPETDFIGVDQWNDGSIPNVTGLLFHEDRAGFLAGALAAMMSNSGSVAAVLATEQAPAIVAFKEGYEAGAKFVDPNINVISVYHPGNFDTAFTDPQWGADTAKAAIASGADVVFGVGGTTGNGAVIETAAQGGAYCIGVDSDQWYTLPEARSCLVSSAMKLISPGVFDLISAAKDGSFPGGVYYGQIGMAPYHDFDDVVPESVKTKMEELEQNLTNGTISTGYMP